MNYRLILVFLIIPLELFSQTDSLDYHPNYLFLGTSADFVNTRDFRQSSLIYFGAGGGLDVGYYREGKKFTQKVNISNHVASALNLNSDLGNSYVFYFGQFDYTFLKNSKKAWRGNNLKWGFVSHNRVLSRYQGGFSNNAISYDAIFGIDGAFYLNKNFTFLKHDFQYSNLFRLSLFDFNLKPSFSYPAPFGFTILADNLFQQVIKSLEFDFLTQLPAFEYKAELQHEMYNGNRWKLFYQWQFHKIKSDYNRYAAIHSMGMVLYFSF